jgi:hypothetical protein
MRRRPMIGTAGPTTSTTQFLDVPDGRVAYDDLVLFYVNKATY